MALCLKTITDQPENKVQPYLLSEATTILQQAIKFQLQQGNSPKQKHTCEVFGKFLLQFHGSLKCLPGLLFR